MSGLERFRVEGDETVGGGSWMPVTPVCGAGEVRWVLAFDQSLSSTGWAYIKVHEEGWDVIKVGMVKTEKLLKNASFEDSFQRGVLLYRGICEALDMCKPDVVVHEMPTVSRRPTAKSEGGPIAGLAVRIAAAQRGHEVLMLNAQKVKQLLTGNQKAEKKEVRAALQRFVNRVALMSYQNDDVYDAVALAVVGSSKEAC